MPVFRPLKIDVKPMNEEEWTNRKTELMRSYFTNSASTKSDLSNNVEITQERGSEENLKTDEGSHDDEESIPDRSSSLWCSTTAPSLSSSGSYTPLPELLVEEVNYNYGDETNSFYERLERKVLEILKSPDSNMENSTDREDEIIHDSSKGSLSEENFSKRSSVCSLATPKSRKSQQKRHLKKPKAADVAVQTSFHSYSEPEISSSKLSEKRKEILRAIINRKFFVGEVKIYNVCKCDKHICGEES